MQITIGSDQHGSAYKQMIMKVFSENEYVDVGTFDTEPVRCFGMAEKVVYRCMVAVSEGAKNTATYDELVEVDLMGNISYDKNGMKCPTRYASPPTLMKGLLSLPCREACSRPERKSRASCWRVKSASLPAGISALLTAPCGGHNLRLQNNLPDTCPIICSIEGNYDNPDINHIVITAGLQYLTRFTSTN